MDLFPFFNATDGHYSQLIKQFNFKSKLVYIHIISLAGMHGKLERTDGIPFAIMCSSHARAHAEL
jgi:hypothetical protein